MYNTAPVTASRLEQLFALQAACTPHAPAIHFKDQVLSYEEVEAMVETMSADLLRHGVGPGVLVAVSLQRVPSLIALLLAIFKAGGAFLPLDARYPPERTRFVLADSGAALLILDADSPNIAEFDGTILELVGSTLVQRSHQSPRVATLPPELAYVIYTSGSTGVPKGVMLGHSATHLVEWARGAYTSQERSRVAAATSLCFDPSIFEIFVPLCTGGTVILKENALEPFAAAERPTMLGTVPSVLTELCRTRAIPSSVTVLNVGGELLRADLAREVHRTYPGLTLCNHYGPTEATTCATVAKLPHSFIGEPAIGRPVAGAEIIVLDADGQTVADGMTGEIHIGGTCLALGYLNRPELTADRFVERDSRRLYRTGDLGAWRDGELHFGGRVDRQVKIRGFRVELGEVEVAMSRLPHVEDSAAVLREVAGRSQLIGYVQSSGSTAESGLRAALRAWLPDYMVPSRVLVLQVFPRLVSGKLDYASLPWPEAVLPGSPGQTIAAAERPIIQVFEEVLARTDIGPDDSFFDLGGDSLSSVWAALRLGEILGGEVPAALIHHAPTPRALARALEHGRVLAQGHLSVLNSSGAGTPLFCTADLFGHAFNYLSLATRLAGERPVYGLSPAALQNQFARDRDLRSLTEAFKAEVRRVQPRGPYLIAGYSAGGILAFDVAAALEQEGHRVQLILLDAYLHSRRPSLRSAARWVTARMRGLLDRKKFAEALRQNLTLAGKLVREMTPGLARAPDWVPRSQVPFAVAMIRASLRFRPGKFSGPTLIIKARVRTALDDLFDEDGALGWSDALMGHATHVTVAGNHAQFIREPLVAETAEAVTRFLADRT